MWARGLRSQSQTLLPCLQPETCHAGCKRRWAPRTAFCGASQVALVVKNLPASAGDIKVVSLIPGSGRSPGAGHGNPLQYSCLEKPMDRAAWRAIVHRVAERRTRMKYLACVTAFCPCHLRPPAATLGHHLGSRSLCWGQSGQWSHKEARMPLTPLEIREFTTWSHSPTCRNKPKACHQGKPFPLWLCLVC